MATTPTLEERVAKLECVVAQLVADSSKGDADSTKDWRRTLGMFPPNDPVMEQIIEEGRKIREADRKRAKKPKR
jgi:hypothetical protein